MSQSTTVLTKKRRGPAPTGKGELIGVRLQPDVLAGIDTFRRLFPGEGLSRPEAIRTIVKERLAKYGMLGER